MQKRKTDEKGFTLIEVIVTLVLVGITAAMAGMWIVSVANGYIFAKVNAKTAQNAQLAMTRLVKEFTAIKSVDNSSGTQITYTRTGTNPITGDPLSVPGAVSLSLSGSELLLNNNTLTDNVSVNGFTLQYYDNSTSCALIGESWSSTSRIIKITLILTGGNNTPVEFVRRVAPRNL